MTVPESEQKIIFVLRNHEGGIGDFLTSEEKERIIKGRPDEPENNNPIDEELPIESDNHILKISF